MTDPANLPAWVSSLVALFVVAGAALTLCGSVGLLRLPTFFQRIHAPTLGTTLGAGAILIGSMLYFTIVESRLVVEEILVAVFLTVTTPISFVLLAMAARRRDRHSGGVNEESQRIENRVSLE